MFASPERAHGAAAADQMEAQRMDFPVEPGRRGSLVGAGLGVKSYLDDQEPWRM